jgi:hypothetical protein
VDDEISRQILLDHMNSPEFRLAELENENKRLRADLGRLRTNLVSKTKSIHFWRDRAGGGFSSLFSRKGDALAKPDSEQRTVN